MPPLADRAVISLKDFDASRMGQKSMNLQVLANRVPDWI